MLEPDLRTRDRELTEIAKSIASLAELFKDLSVLVIDQGTLLDSVEYNIEQTAVHVQEAVKELSVATRYVTLHHVLNHQNSVL
jgi:syntaxin 16